VTPARPLLLASLLVAGARTQGSFDYDVVIRNGR
jgi:hypothetical protein